MTRLAILASTVDVLLEHFQSAGLFEDGAFCLLREGRGSRSRRLVALDPILPPPGAWESQGSDHLRPSARWISAAISQAHREGAGLLFVHSHPNPAFPAGLSLTDRDAFAALGPMLAEVLDGPVGTAVVHPSGWSAVVWDGDHISEVERVVAVGRSLRQLSAPASPYSSPLDDRQRDALGAVHDQLRLLSVAIVGCGGVGSPLAEQVVRMGVVKVVLVDCDRLDTPSNVRRVFGSTVHDLDLPGPPAKVDVVARHLGRLGLQTGIETVHGDVRTEAVFRALLDVDIVLCCTDTHASRAVLNDLPSTYLLPVIDVGVRVGSRLDGGLAGLVAEVRVLTPCTPCLWCRGAIDSNRVRDENLPQDERRKLDQEGYLLDRPDAPAPSVIALTVLASGMASCALLALLSSEADVSASGYLFDGLYGDSLETRPKVPRADCRCQERVGRGDACAPPFVA